MIVKLADEADGLRYSLMFDKFFIKAVIFKFHDSLADKALEAKDQRNLIRFVVIDEIRG